MVYIILLLESEFNQFSQKELSEFLVKRTLTTDHQQIRNIGKLSFLSLSLLSKSKGRCSLVILVGLVAFIAMQDPLL